MTRRFSVIEGGLGRAEADQAADAEPAEMPFTVDLQPSVAVSAEAVAAWRALLVRAEVSDPLQDPDYLLTAAQHQAAGLRVAFALVWSAAEEAPSVLRGVLPLQITRSFLARDRARLWRPPDLFGPPVLQPDSVDAILAAVRTRLAALGRPIHLESLPDPVGAAPPVSRAADLAPVRRLGRSVPTASLLGVRPGDYQPPQVEHVRDPGLIRDAVENFLALDARTARRPIIADPTEATMVRVVTRLFARRRQINVELARRGNTLVAGTLHLGSGTGMVAWRHAAGF